VVATSEKIFSLLYFSIRYLATNSAAAGAMVEAAAEAMVEAEAVAEAEALAETAMELEAASFAPHASCFIAAVYNTKAVIKASHRPAAISFEPLFQQLSTSIKLSIVLRSYKIGYSLLMNVYIHIVLNKQIQKQVRNFH
jgi:hypothetical protein